MLFDAHCHLQLPKLQPMVRECVEAALRHRVPKMVCNGCCPDDWGRVLQLADEFPHAIYPSIGVHPWWVEESIGGDWRGQLSAHLQQRPRLCIGECGLDKARRGNKSLWDVQQDVLRQHLELASNEQRPVSLHCVQAYGSLLEQLKAHLRPLPFTPGIVLHSFAGPPEMVPDFARLNCYFSFSSLVLHSDKVVRSLQAVPLDRLLIETDSPDQLPQRLTIPLAAEPTQDATFQTVEADGMEGRAPVRYVRSESDGSWVAVNEPCHLGWVCEGVAKCLGRPVDEIRQLTYDNAVRVFDGPWT
ncbi:unnamed protein product [Vitrella brassicaformis CCMP3155]|uniref:TatD related DNase n=1 Tax=Vitrella brassicaformis (strain CCMP3155) TaxID=1169540 RepID=A0A0G4GHL2_VITBC|nr:unnamed protein product [Vitrella brassicaformis CCMP3155]|mmetsp:Transcript_22454/g.55347  ORF Transcript_22454/g.55347 Transcript_22454/m.55347 type:complete len:301 (-) Transcript_22454:1023-1925(-)|eukprot:CEM29183.1 unnamed protein product [Vitrella brassicaformis CCMP3155]